MLVLALAAIVPLALLAGYASWQDQQLERLRAHEQAASLSRIAAESAEGFAAHARAVLGELATELAFATDDVAAARQVLAAHLRAFPTACADITAAHADGTVYAESQAAPAAPPASIAGQPYFQEAMQSGQLVIQSVAQGEQVRLVFCQPILDSTGQPIGTVQATCDPADVQALALPLPLPQGAGLALIDPQHTILLRTGDPARESGPTLPAGEAALAAGGPDGTREGPFLGQAMLMSTSTVTDAPWRVLVAVPATRALGGWQASTWGLGVAFAVALAAALFLGVRTATLGRQGWQQRGYLRSLLDSASVGVGVVSRPDNRLDFANPLFQRFLGWPREAAAGRTLRQIAAPDLAEAVEGHVAMVYRTGHAARAREMSVLTGRPPRTDYWDVDFLPLRSREGHADAVLILALPVTERVRARREVEALARQAEERAGELQAVLTAITDAVLVFDAGGHLRFVNDAVIRHVGLAPTPEALQRLEAAVRTTEMYWADGRSVEPDERQLTRVLRGESIVGEELMYRLPMGRALRWERISAAPVRDGEGRITGAVVTAGDITAQKEAQAERERLLAEVQAAHENLRIIIDRLPDGVIVVDTAQRVVLANDTTRRYVGRDVTGMTLAELRHIYGFVMPDGRPFPPGQAPIERAMRGESVAGVEARILRIDGHAIDALESAAPLFDSKGRLSGAVVALTDITAQKEAQAERERLLAAVDEARRNLQTTLEWLPAGVVAVGLNLQVVLTNNMIRQYLRRDLLGASIRDVVDEYGIQMPDGQPFTLDEHSPILRALAGEVLSNLEVVAHLPDGRRLNVLASVAPMRRPDGGITGAVIAMLDVTVERQAQAERERLLAEVQTARANLQTVLNRLPDGVLVIDPSLHITLCNEPARARIGRDVTGEPVQRLWRELHFASGDGRPFPPGETPVERALRGETVVGVEVSLEFAGGKHVDALDSAAPLYNPDGTVREVAMVFTDITPLKELDRAKDQFISVAAHELRTPLTALKGHAQILLRRAERAGWAEPDRQSLHTIDNQVDRLNDLIERLLDVSRIRLGRLKLSREPTDVVALARQVARELQVTTDRHRITVQADEPELVGNWDPAALRQVLTNLVGNAIRYADPGPIEVRISRDDGWAMVSVTDHGPGIPPAQQAQIFEAFRLGGAEERPKGGGLGLGLYISRGIVQAHGGQIWLQSQVGVGSTFAFSLPLGELA